MDENEQLQMLSSKDTTGKAMYDLFRCDAFKWLNNRPPLSIHAVVTDPPYGLREYDEDQLEKRKNGNGGVWRIPPSYDGQSRSPLPRFTILNGKDLDRLENFFSQLATSLIRVLVPGAHVFIATNPLLSHIVDQSFVKTGFEKRGAIIRKIITLRGGDRPKNAHQEFPAVTVMPRACWEPWELLRKPLEGTVADNLRKWKTGGLRRISGKEPFKDLIASSPARGKEKEIAPHPSLKPQHFMRKIVRASLPLGEGMVLDPFMGSGATIAAAVHCGYKALGLDINKEYYNMAVQAVPLLAEL